jgi:hypothetical protein
MVNPMFLVPTSKKWCVVPNHTRKRAVEIINIGSRKRFCTVFHYPGGIDGKRDAESDGGDQR